ncbi:hypothetical protein GF337_15765, partial [candidate division KSB1 bacterium]|nr:hypothetical protein [candidate division KSB1 bacterium]
MNDNKSVVFIKSLLIFGLIVFLLPLHAGLNKSRSLSAGKHSFTIYGITGNYGGNIPLGGRNSTWPNYFTERGGQPGDPWYSVVPVTGNEQTNFGPNGMMIGVRNWQAPEDWTNSTSAHPGGQLYEYYVSEYGLRYDDSDLNECFLKNNMMWTYLRQLPCAITLLPSPGEALILPNITWGEGVGEGLDPNQFSDQMVTSEYTHSIGLTVKKRAFAFVAREHDD